MGRARSLAAGARPAGNGGGILWNDSRGAGTQGRNDREQRFVDRRACQGGRTGAGNEQREGVPASARVEGAELGCLGIIQISSSCDGETARIKNMRNQASLLDWRGFETHDATKISGAGCWFGGGSSCLRRRVAGAEEYPGGGFGVDGRVSWGLHAADAVSNGGAGADCDFVVYVSGVHLGARPNTRVGGVVSREDGVERGFGARQRKIQHIEDLAVDRAFPVAGQGVPGGPS